MNLNSKIDSSDNVRTPLTHFSKRWGDQASHSFGGAHSAFRPVVRKYMKFWDCDLVSNKFNNFTGWELPFENRTSSNNFVTLNNNVYYNLYYPSETRSLNNLVLSTISAPSRSLFCNWDTKLWSGYHSGPINNLKENFDYIPSKDSYSTMLQQIEDEQELHSTEVRRITNEIEQLNLRNSDLFDLIKTKKTNCIMNKRYNKNVIELEKQPDWSDRLIFANCFTMKQYELLDKVSFIVETQSEVPLKFLFGCHRMSLRSNSLRFYINDLNNDKSCFSYYPTLSITTCDGERILTKRTEFVKQRSKGVSLGEIDFDELCNGEYDLIEFIDSYTDTNKEQNSDDSMENTFKSQTEDELNFDDSTNIKTTKANLIRINRKIQFTLQIELKLNKKGLKKRLMKQSNMLLNH